MDTPIAIVEASLIALPRLTAEESFLAATRVALGSGSLPSEEARSLQREWARLTDRARHVAATRPSAEDLAAIGVAVTEIPRG